MYVGSSPGPSGLIRAYFLRREGAVTKSLLRDHVKREIVGREPGEGEGQQQQEEEEEVQEDRRTGEETGEVECGFNPLPQKRM